MSGLTDKEAAYAGKLTDKGIDISDRHSMKKIFAGNLAGGIVCAALGVWFIPMGVGLLGYGLYGALVLNAYGVADYVPESNAAFIAAAAVMLFFQVTPSVHAIWGIPFIVIVVTIFASGLGLLISSLAVYFRDMTHLWGVLMTAWVDFTPLFYPVEVLPDVVQQVMWFNPMYHYVTFFRDIMMWDINPGGMECLVCLGMAVITFLVGLIVFRKLQSKFILYI